MRRGLNQYEQEVLDDTGLSMPRFAHLRNHIKCERCHRWLRAKKYLGKELCQEDKDADAWSADVHPGCLCGRCARQVNDGAPLDIDEIILGEWPCNATN